ncbi:MAG: hypothetical protein DSZ10_01080 [Sulfurovum sp.]|nr:MAG: hypothetical protein DSZ10_01080 [Sulfurovum sp.]
MVRYSMFSNNKEMLEKFSKYSKIYGVIFLLIGLAGMFYPTVMSVATALFYGWLLIFSAFMIGFHTWQTNIKDWLGWLKAFIFFIIGALIVINPAIGIAALGILFAVYFLMDAFASFALAFELKPASMWWLSLLNGILSIAIGLFFIVGWPISSFFLVGFLVGVSLFFDGILLLGMASAAKKTEEKIS